MIKNADRKIILENGSEYYGTGFGSTEDKVTELVFNTSMVGYQEILSDPSYTAQGIVMTYPLIGNYGMADDDYETKTPTADALIVREYNDEPSNFRSRETLGEVMLRYGISGVSGIDTRKLTREIRTYGTCKALIRHFYQMGFNIEATVGAANFLKANGIRTRILRKLSEGSTEILDSIRAGYVSYIVNTRAILSGVHYEDGVAIRNCAVENGVTTFTLSTLSRFFLMFLKK
ncbi:MAG: carbamoyl-phosphate synthase domain-containing protein [Acutalibacteraceae bacterium]